MIDWFRRTWNELNREVNPQMPPDLAGRRIFEIPDPPAIHPFELHRANCPECDRGFDPCPIGRELLRR